MPKARRPFRRRVWRQRQRENYSRGASQRPTPPRIDPWAVDPWYYPSPEEHAALLTSFSFRVDYMELIARPTRLPGDILGWLEVFAQPFRNAVAPSVQQEFLNEVRNELEPTLRDTGGTWTADYVRLRFKATNKQN
jgi:hypothetical protein